MLGLFRPQPDPAAAREAFLAAIPVRNDLVEESDAAPGKFRLKAPVRPTLIRRMFGSGSSTRSFEFDDLGAAVWRAIDSKTTVERIITAFAAAHRLNLREAEVSVTAFLKMLMHRNLIALVTRDVRRAAPDRKRKGRKSR